MMRAFSLLAIALIVSGVRAEAQKYKREDMGFFAWAEGQPFASEHLYEGVPYRTITTPPVMVSIGQPTLFYRGNVIVYFVTKNTGPNAYDVRPEQVSCECVEKAKEGKRLKPLKFGRRYRDFNVSMEKMQLKANTIVPNGFLSGLLFFEGKCKRYMVRAVIENGVFEFPFDQTRVTLTSE